MHFKRAIHMTCVIILKKKITDKFLHNFDIDNRKVSSDPGLWGSEGGGKVGFWGLNSPQ